jgi:hypothetical protein
VSNSIRNVVPSTRGSTQNGFTADQAFTEYRSYSSYHAPWDEPSSPSEWSFWVSHRHSCRLYKYARSFHIFCIFRFYNSNLRGHDWWQATETWFPAVSHTVHLDTSTRSPMFSLKLHCVTIRGFHGNGNIYSLIERWVFSDNSLFCVASFCSPHTSLSLSESIKTRPNLQYSDSFLSCATYSRTVSPSF